MIIISAQVDATKAPKRIVFPRNPVPCTDTVVTVAKVVCKGDADSEWSEWRGGVQNRRHSDCKQSGAGSEQYGVEVHP